MTFKIFVVYYLTLVGFVACLMYAETSGSVETFPASWQRAIFCAYYVAPVLIACIFGFLFRPFWKNFRNLLASILLIHFLYSVVILGWRQLHLSDRQELLLKSSLAVVKAEPFAYRMLDNTQDGLVDEIVLWGNLDVSDLPAGRYIMEIVLSQDGKIFSRGIVDRRGFRKNQQKKIEIRFAFDPQKYGRHFERSVDVDLHIDRLLEVDEETGRLVKLSRWTPFLRTTSWQGQDKDFYMDMVRVETLYGVASVELFL